jgi:hypothetical protein
VKIPKDGKRPDLLCTVEWQDPTATTIGLPTSIEIEARWDVDGSASHFESPGLQAPFTLAGGRPLIVRARFTHDLRDDQMKFNLSVEGGGPDGLIAIHAAEGDTVPKIFVTATALATALMADAKTNPDPNRDAGGTTLHLLLVAATALSSFFTKRGSVIVHGAEVEGNVALANGPLRLRIDYSVDVVVEPIKLGVMSIGMNDAVPMRIRYRNVLLEVDFTKSGPEMFSLSFAGCSTLAEDPGGWLIDSPGSLLDILGTRSGHGSLWFEVDLRFALDLGPVKVSGATVRATFADGTPKVELRGLDITLDTSPLLTAHGAAHITEGGFDAELGAELPALGVGAAVGLEHKGQDLLVLSVGLDVPAPIPLASSGLGLFGIGGIFGINGTMKPLGPDPIKDSLAWDFGGNDPPVDPRKGGLLLGLGAVVGTVPDMGYAFGAKAVIMVATPDTAVRASLDATFLKERPKMADVGHAPANFGVATIGLLAIDEDAVSLALRGQLDLKPLLEVLIPVAARFPYSKSDWFIHIGSDQVNLRTPEKVQVTVLPDIVKIAGWAFLMLHGDGISNFADLKKDLHGLALGTGFGFDIEYVMAVALLEMSAHVYIGLATNPFMLIGDGGLSGTLHLGPFSLGVSAEVKFQVGPGDARMLFLEVCGEVDLWFTTLRGCVSIGTDNIQFEIPDPGVQILDSVQLMDHNGRLLGQQPLLAPDTAGDPPPNLPTVWPDTLIALEFSTGPALAVNPVVLKGIDVTHAGKGLYGVDELHYTYTLTGLDLAAFDRKSHTWKSVDFGTTPGQGAWQIPRYATRTDPNASGARELVLLTGETHVWTRNLTDGGTSLPEDPIKSVVDDCAKQFDAILGWALGRDAQRVVPAHWTLPGEGSRLQRFYSYFQVDLAVQYLGVELSERAAAAQDRPQAVHPGGPIVFAAELDGGRRTYRGGLQLPHFDVLDRTHFDLRRAQARLVVTDGLSGAELHVLWRGPGLFNEGLSVQALQAGVLAPAGAVLHDTRQAPGGAQVLVFGFDGPGEAGGFTIDYAAEASVVVLGVSGFTHAAVQDANDATKDAQDGAQGRTKAANEPPGNRRPLLTPDTIYKITTVVAVAGQRKEQTKGFQEQVHTFYFQTAALKKPVSVFSLEPQRHIRQLVDAFDPAYLARYITGWLPEDRAEFWFLGDPVAAHFSVDYIAGLAELYGHEVALQVRRTDTPPGAVDAGVEFAKDHMIVLTQASFLSAADQRLGALSLAAAQAGSPCRVASPGATLAGLPALAPNAHYDLAVAFPEKGARDRTPLIPGIVFGTSRFRGPADLLEALGFKTGGVPGNVTGDVPITLGPVGGSADGDRTLEDALERLGQAAWPAAQSPRTSALWSQVGGVWQLAGVLLEAPEPIHRAGPTPKRDRLAITGLSCGGRSFEIMRRSASGSRVLFLTTQPFTPGGTLDLAATEVPPTAPQGAVPTPIVAHCAVAVVPAFVEEII